MSSDRQTSGQLLQSVGIDVPKLQPKVLRRAPDSTSYRLYRAAQEWDLIDPILIRDRTDLKSEPKWREHIAPYHHQITNLVTFCRRLPVTLLADDVGLGKTISAGLIVSELMSRKRLSKILVVCPKLLVPQWKEELESKFGIVAIGATGNELLKVKVPDGGGAVITTYNSARMHLPSLAQSGFEMLILDEAHKLRNLYGPNQSPQVAQRFRQALSERMFKYVLMLTATPIHNRLWDIYSLVDLLAVARGHQNPFGSDGVFARTFIADDRTEARKLAPKMRETFRSIVYQYMSRVRRADANLHFPERVVQLHRVDPLPEEHELIDAIGESIHCVQNRLAQISILQALVSSPHALSAQLRTMAGNGTVPQALASKVEQIVARIPTTAKLQGLGTLVDKLRAEQPQLWRTVIFTTRRETQTSIEEFLQQRGVRCGLINGESATRNQQTISKFKKSIPDINVIVSTEAGAEGVNLQSANVLVNFDLPWNPMIVEQRIGRIQRLASEHASVCIFNMILRNTFEEYIVGRLMEKLQMAAHAIGDIEALLEAAGMNDQNEEHLAFEELIRQLVVTSLAGKNVEESTRLAETSIAAAKVELERQEKNIDVMLGSMDESDEIPYPHLPEVVRSMGAQDFVLAAMNSLGTPFVSESEGVYFCERDGKVDKICFDDDHSSNAVLYQPGTAPFSRLVSRVVTTGLHTVEDADEKPRAIGDRLAKEWVQGFGGKFSSIEIKDVARSFSGTAIVKLRVTVGHDSYERIVNVPVPSGEVWVSAGITGASPISDPIKNAEAVGLSTTFVVQNAIEDVAIMEFCRFYIERRKQELSAAGEDLRKRKKIEDDFTPRLEASLIGLEGNVRRRLNVACTFELGEGNEYSSLIEAIPSENRISESPDMLPCPYSERIAPRGCFARCEVSGSLVLRHLLVKSEVSDRLALSQFIGTCTVTHKRALIDELDESSITHQMVVKSVLRTSEVSARRAEPEFFGKCGFTGIQALEEELATSEISGKKYRRDKQLRSVVSGKTGYAAEFILCSETGQPLLAEEADKCSVSSKLVVPGLLVSCGVTGQKVQPTFVERSAASGKAAQKIFFVSSSISGTRLLPDEGVKSATGKYCLESEARVCLWSGKKYHPEDLRTCELTRVTAHFEFMTANGQTRLHALVDLLNGVRRRTDLQELWPSISAMAARTVDTRSEVESAILSQSGEYLAVCLQSKNWLGLKTRQSGLLYAIRDRETIGRVVLGKRGDDGWVLQITI